MGLGIRTALADVRIRGAFSPVVSVRHRWKLLRRMGWTGVEESHIRDGCLFIGYNLSLGQGSYLNRQVFVDASARVSIGRNVQIGQRAMLVTSHHDISTSDNRAGTPRRSPIIIEDGCWIGASALILPGVSIGAGCVIAAGAVVTKDCAPNGLYAGVPAERLRELA